MQISSRAGASHKNHIKNNTLNKNRLKAPRYPINYRIKNAILTQPRNRLNIVSH
ncbi:Hypothetical protein ETEE_0032 [Edwardsiella anguillarum ET080813]|uniref:Uncharacterized protein n=1 Tax=Edwardsiella anguillarum ET080813 TaxID=667120 RepID=A0A076LJ01_9GAMM|nr:Hypothetical protein ETEE_0032 [Edwardsiella anguillarum ET080813]